MQDIEVLYETAKKLRGEGYYAEAANLYRQIGELEFLGEKRVSYYLLAADAFMDAELSSDAIANCRTALEIDATSAMAWRSLGSALISGQQDDEAERALIKSLELSPSPTAYIYLADLCIRHRRYNDAEQFCHQALKVSVPFLL